ncbi:hypothetical protein [Marinibactrum halimedae]|uniref:Uncharacterized protein n=1 Tax=Marinibactrum halimedae TaxID=1444977 RepID=A0AA37TAB8_9GAMM|nr:hypothetical protein [Marinibactrum halimedae]MCD9461236.1 hypothetical protein [Marinibactrum halimedae]GLS25647.1 hypothetical protein GCM10007877_13610 [Marinibactrum halimedae]
MFYLGASQYGYYDIIEKQAKALIDSYGKSTRFQSDLLAWYVKALSSSGQEKYRSLIQQAKDLNHERLNFHASLSLIMLDRFKVWYGMMDTIGPIIDASQFDLHFLLLSAPYLSLKESGAVFLKEKRYNTDPLVIEKSFEEFSLFYPYVRRSKRQVSPAIRMMQMMALSGNEKYLNVLKKAEETAPSEHVRAHAKAQAHALRRRM